MTDRRWTGNVNNDANTPGNWDPNGAPQPGDALFVGRADVRTATIDITGNDLQGDILTIALGQQVTLNLSDHANAKVEIPTYFGSTTVNIDGTALLDLSASVPPDFNNGPVTVNMAEKAHLAGS